VGICAIKFGNLQRFSPQSCLLHSFLYPAALHLTWPTTPQVPDPEHDEPCTEEELWELKQELRAFNREHAQALENVRAHAGAQETQAQAPGHVKACIGAQAPKHRRSVMSKFAQALKSSSRSMHRRSSLQAKLCTGAQVLKLKHAQTLRPPSTDAWSL